MSCTGEMKTRAQRRHNLCSHWLVGQSGWRCTLLRIDNTTAVMRAAHADWQQRQAKLSIETRCRKDRREGEALSGGGERRGDARPLCLVRRQRPVGRNVALKPSHLPFSRVSRRRQISLSAQSIVITGRWPGPCSWTWPPGGCGATAAADVLPLYGCFETSPLTTQRASFQQGVT